MFSRDAVIAASAGWKMALECANAIRHFSLKMAMGAAVAAMLCWGPISVAAPSKRCMAGRLPALKAGGFSGPLLCDERRASFSLVGKVEEARKIYTIYDYRYRLKPPDGSVAHGGQRLIVLDSDGEYVGQYASSPSVPWRAAIHGKFVVISMNGIEKGRIEFKGGPPVSALVDGEVLTLFK